MTKIEKNIPTVIDIIRNILLILFKISKYSNLKLFLLANSIHETVGIIIYMISIKEK